MQIAILGTGAIGSTFAYQLSRAGHSVTVVARGQRLAQLQHDQAIVLSSGERAAVQVRAALEPSEPHDLILVTVLAPQLEVLLPSLRASAARSIMYMFNTFDSLDPLREAAGSERARFGFPMGVFALLEEGRLTPQIRRGTTVDDARWAEIFTAAGIPTVVEPDMQGWLRAHAALVVPLMSTGVTVLARGAGLSWKEARTQAEALLAGFAVVRAMGHVVRPPAIDALSRLPRAVLTAMLWASSRTRMLRDLGKLGPGEARMLVDSMTAAAPGQTGALRAVRP